MKMDTSMTETFAEIPEAVERFDEFGFAVFKDGQRNSDDRHHEYKKFELNSHQVSAWHDMLSNWSHTQLHAPERLRAYLKKGLPPHLRPRLWKNILGCQQLQEASTFNYKEHVAILRLQLSDLGISEYTLKDAHQEMWSENARTPNEETQLEMGRKMLHLHTIRQIIVDVDRTFATHRLFMQGCSEAVEGRAALFRVLGVYAHYNPEVGYCQGMSYLAGMLLMHMKDEEEAFWSMVALFEKPKYLTGYFDDHLSKIQEHALVFQKLLHNRMRNLDKHLKSLECNPLVFVTPWFMCLYTSYPCWDTVLAIWDLILLDGISTIFRVALAVLYLGRTELLESEDLSSLLPQLLHPPLECVHYDSLMPMVWKVSVEKWEITSLQHIVAEEKLRKLGLKRSRSKGEIVTTAIQPTKKSRLGSDKNNNENDGVDSDSASTSSGSIFKRVMNMFTPQSQNVLQDTTNDPLGQSPDQGQKVKDDVKGYKVTEQLKENRARSRLRTRGPGGARLLGTSEMSSKPPGSANESLWSMVGGSSQGVYSPSHGVIGHPFEMHWSAENQQFEPIVRFSKRAVNVPSTSTEGDRMSPCLQAGEERNKKGKKRRVRFTYPDPDFVEEQEPKSPVVTIHNSSSQGQSSSVKQSSKVKQHPLKSTHGHGSKVNVPKSPHVASIYWRRKLAGCGNPLNVPTNRKLIGESARLQHSFKTFHTPAPLRRSQRLRLSSSPCLSSPEVELKFFGGNCKAGSNTPDYPGDYLNQKDSN